MIRLTRRAFLRSSAGGALAVAGLSGCRTGAGEIAPTAARRVVVIGGGWGGATAARYLRMADPSVEVLLLEPSTRFVSCPLSNLVLSGVRNIGTLTFDYRGLRERGVDVRHEPALALEPDRHRVRLAGGYLRYDRVIVSPGVEFQWEQVDGLSKARDTVLHAWKAGPQTVALAGQLQDLHDGGVVVMTVPPAAYRCPPGPYERACQIAWYLKTRKPRSKLIVLDANPSIVSKAGLFQAAWRAYPNLEYRASNKVVKVDPARQEVTTEFGDTVRYDVVNLIPPQRAGTIAVEAGLVGNDRRWCEVDHITYESVKARDVHVVGDATIGLPVPKSGTIANAMGKIAAVNVVNLLNGRAAAPMAPLNTCYSWVSDREVVAVVNAYGIAGGKVVQIEQKLTPGASTVWADHAVAWATSIWSDILG
jgi:sulfide dehydrogenase [flavocytochrome c] flavoprotein subunit